MRNDRLGKYLSYILRHEPERIDMKLDENGWINFQDMISGINRVEKFKIKKEDVEREVVEDEKGRFEISKDRKYIRCVQGHKAGLTNLKFKTVNGKEEVPDFLFHGTKESVLNSIMEQGINKGTRDYVHLTENKKIATENGERWKEKKVLLIKIDTKKMIEDGFVFLKSNNDVWLVESVPSKYFINTNILNNKKEKKRLKNI